MMIFWLDLCAEPYMSIELNYRALKVIIYFFLIIIGLIFNHLEVNAVGFENKVKSFLGIRFKYLT